MSGYCSDAADAFGDAGFFYNDKVFDIAGLCDMAWSKLDIAT
jgi:hypothetical protein